MHARVLWDWTAGNMGEYVEGQDSYQQLLVMAKSYFAFTDVVATVVVGKKLTAKVELKTESLNYREGHL